MHQAQNNSNQRIHFYNLDVLRFFAAFLIVFMHGYHAVLGWSGIPELLRRYPDISVYEEKNLNAIGLFLKRLIDNFDLGVEFFFLISGFLITYLLLNERTLTGKIHLPKFYMRRFLRIWPLYFIVLGITPLLVSWTQASHPHYLWNALFLNNYATIHYAAFEPGLAHLWSICIEEHFYLLWPVLLLMVPVNRLPYLFGLLIAISVCFKWYYFHYASNAEFHLKVNTLCRMDTLAIGGWIAWIVSKKPFAMNIPGWIRIMVYTTFILLFCSVDVHQKDDVLQVLFVRPLFTAFFVFILLNYLFNPNAWLNFKQKNTLHYLGKISFGIYMYHNLLFSMLYQKIIWPLKIDGFWWFWLVYISVVLLISIVSFEFLEKPILKWKDRFAIVQTRR
jgi:peptidoglycan/LPS O-acetylase OafA/YrhL